MSSSPEEVRSTHAVLVRLSPRSTQASHPAGPHAFPLGASCRHAYREPHQRRLAMRGVCSVRSRTLCSSMPCRLCVPGGYSLTFEVGTVRARRRTSREYSGEKVRVGPRRVIFSRGGSTRGAGTAPVGSITYSRVNVCIIWALHVLTSDVHTWFYGKSNLQLHLHATY